MAQTQFYRRKCDFCGHHKDFPVGGITPELEIEMEGWITLAREYIVQGQPFPVVKHACKDSCASNLITTKALSLPEHVQAAKDGTNIKPFPVPPTAQGGTA